MSAPVDEPTWDRPPEDECEETTFTGPVTGAPDGDYRLKMRMVRHLISGNLTEFAVVFQFKIGNTWADVVEIDSCHHVDVHLHQYCQSTRERVGNRELLRVVENIEEVQIGYVLAYDHVETNWQRLMERWRRG